MKADRWEDLSLAVAMLVQCNVSVVCTGKSYHCGHVLRANRAPRAVDRRFTAN